MKVPIDKIISSESARGKFESIVKEVAADKEGIYVLTSNGNPVAAVVNLNLLGVDTNESNLPSKQEVPNPPAAQQNQTPANVGATDGGAGSNPSGPSGYSEQLR